MIPSPGRDASHGRKNRGSEAEHDLGKLIDDVEVEKTPSAVERNRERVAAVVPIGMYQGWVRQRTAFFVTLQTASECADLSEEETAAEVEAIREVESAR